MVSPNFYAVLDYITLDPAEWGLPRVGTLYLLQFTTRDLANPDADPIAMYFYAGMRRYVWQDKFWSEFEVHAAPLLKKVTERIGNRIEEGGRLERLVDMLKHYKRSCSPTDQDTIDNPRTADIVFCRVLYQINPGSEGATLRQQTRGVS